MSPVLPHIFPLLVVDHAVRNHRAARHSQCGATTRFAVPCQFGRNATAGNGPPSPFAIPSYRTIPKSRWPSHDRGISRSCLSDNDWGLGVFPSASLWNAKSIRPAIDVGPSTTPRTNSTMLTGSSGSVKGTPRRHGSPRCHRSMTHSG